VNLQGASGALDYDPVTEETSAPVEVWVIGAAAGGGYEVQAASGAGHRALLGQAIWLLRLFSVALTLKGWSRRSFRAKIAGWPSTHRRSQRRSDHVASILALGIVPYCRHFR
jgi:hypothetical protein